MVKFIDGESIWKRNFNYLFYSRLVKISADSFAFNSILWLLIYDGEGAIGTALLIAVTFLPEAFLAPITGPFMKKNTLKFWMYFSDITRAAVVLIIPICYFNGFSPLWFVMALMILHSATGAAYNPASVAIIPQIVNEQGIQKANALLQSSAQIVRLGAFTLCGAILTFIGPAYTMLFALILYLISGFLVLFIKYKTVQTKTMDLPAATQRGTYFGRLKRGFVLVRKHQILYPLAIYCIFMNLAAAPWEALSAVYVAEELNSLPITFSLLKAVTSGGAFLMGFLLAKVKVNKYGLLFVTAGIIEGIAFFITGMNTFLPLVFLAAFAFGAAVSAINVPEYTIIQTSVDEEDQPQVYAVIHMISNLSLPAGAIACGYAANAFGSGKVIAVGGAIEILAGIGILLFTKLAKAQRSDLIREREASVHI
ncbi:MFS transporter [Bacillus atrophaeus]|uniref:MFS transporter n=1 Tax=Bacillus atrophaeus TaxID=1452 RepID=UPI000D039B6E|nr:MFS transporter [Bacillus atrophaeus]MEC1901228.1 MFS transporter [Bacillus atrophaeus]MEC2396394.1 MFS transporter [Bacillus atrophaeus]MED4433780.1 MFS transporter [Bacillus atrophaeus]MED4564059.1 MFS transporter [Bacillus atrophaeus]MED4573630.1 MFS transporter [Bacillus atrophaeus]